MNVRSIHQERIPRKRLRKQRSQTCTNCWQLNLLVTFFFLSFHTTEFKLVFIGQKCYRNRLAMHACNVYFFTLAFVNIDQFIRITISNSKTLESYKLSPFGLHSSIHFKYSNGAKAIYIMYSMQ